MTDMSPFETSLRDFDPTIRLAEMEQVRPPSTSAINFVVFFRHPPTNRVLGYELTANTWSDVTGLRDWSAPQVPRLPANFHLSAIR